MTEILRSLKADLLDRRLLPILVVLGALLLGAIAYVVLDGGGSGEAGTPVAAGASPAPASSGPKLVVTQSAGNPHAAVAETTVGVRYQHKPGTHDPFAPLPTVKPKSAATNSSSSSSSSSTSAGSGSGSSSTGAGSPSSSGGASTTPSQPTSPTKPKPKPKVEHKLVSVVGVKFGPIPDPGQPAQLVPDENVKQGEALPSRDNPLVVFAKLSGDHKQAIFTLVREAILKGPAVCMPSETQCEQISLQAGQAEELSYVEPTGQSVAYELVLEKISWHEETVKATTSSRHHHHRRHHRR
ncbi:MAG TPA: hypothetical protein VNV42_03715 [Solirubrobacteraceae bacterium]|jgi:hypothetical protein|nr:hypothetical protein [Solirubrobacteraceae bacterium]